MPSDESAALAEGSSSDGGADVLAIVLGSFVAIIVLGAIAFVAILYGPKRRSRTTERLTAQAGVALAARTQQRGAYGGRNCGGGGAGACTVSSTVASNSTGAIPVAEAAVTTKAAITVQRRWRRWARMPSRPKKWQRQPSRQHDVVAAVEVVQAQTLP